MKKYVLKAMFLFGILFSINCYGDELNLEKYKIDTISTDKVGAYSYDYTDNNFKNNQIMTGIGYEKYKETANYVGQQIVLGNYLYNDSNNSDYNSENIYLTSSNKFYIKNRFIGVGIQTGINNVDFNGELSDFSVKSISGEGTLSFGNGRIYNYEHWYLANLIVEELTIKKLINREFTEEEKIGLAKRINEYKENKSIGINKIEEYLLEIGICNNSEDDMINDDVKEIILILLDREYDIKDGKIIFLEYSHRNSFSKSKISDINSDLESKNSDYYDSIGLTMDINKIVSKNIINKLIIKNSKEFNNKYYGTQIQTGSELLINKNNILSANMSYEYSRYKESKYDSISADAKFEHYLYKNIKVTPNVYLSKCLSDGGKINATTKLNVSSDIRINENLRLLSATSISKNVTTGYTSNLNLEIGASYQVRNFEVTPNINISKNVTDGGKPQLLMGIGCTYQID